MKAAVRALVASCAVAIVAGLLETRYPVYSPGAAGSVDTCEGIACQAVDCKPPFKYTSAADSGTCCPLCEAESVTVPEDRSWAKDLRGGVAMNNNADPVLCRGVHCPPADCPEFDQFFDGRCCTKCKSSAAVTPADLAKEFNEESAKIR